MKAYLYGALALVFAVSLYYSFNAGKNVQKGIEAQARQDIADNQVEKIKIVYKEKVKIEVRYRDKVKHIYTVQDPTGCLDTTLGAAGLLSTTTSR